MELGLHTLCIMHTNTLTDIRIAKTCGYDTIELLTPKLVRFLEAGYQLEDLLEPLKGLRVSMMDCLLPIEPQEPEKRRQLRKDCELFSRAAQTYGCRTLQTIALDEYADDDWPSIRKTVAASLQEMADIAKPFDVRLGLEPVAFSRFSTLAQAMEVLEEADRDNIGLVVDTFHLYCGGTPWDEVTKLDPNLIVCAHIADCHPKKGERWSDDDRTALPGDGIVPLAEGIAAIKATGFDGVWSVEMISKYHWEWEPEKLALELKQRSQKFLR